MVRGGARRRAGSASRWAAGNSSEQRAAAPDEGERLGRHQVHRLQRAPLAEVLAHQGAHLRVRGGGGGGWGGGGGGACRGAPGRTQDTAAGNGSLQLAAHSLHSAFHHPCPIALAVPRPTQPSPGQWAACRRRRSGCTASGTRARTSRRPSCVRPAKRARAPAQRCRGSSRCGGAPRRPRWAGGAGSCSRLRGGCRPVSVAKVGGRRARFMHVAVEFRPVPNISSQHGSRSPRCLPLPPKSALHSSPDLPPPHPRHPVRSLAPDAAGKVEAAVVLARVGAPRPPAVQPRVAAVLGGLAPPLPLLPRLAVLAQHPPRPGVDGAGGVHLLMARHRRVHLHNGGGRRQAGDGKRSAAAVVGGQFVQQPVRWRSKGPMSMMAKAVHEEAGGSRVGKWSSAGSGRHLLPGGPSGLSCCFRHIVGTELSNGWGAPRLAKLGLAQLAEHNTLHFYLRSGSGAPHSNLDTTRALFLSPLGRELSQTRPQASAGRPLFRDLLNFMYKTC